MLILAVIVAHLHPFLSHPNRQNNGGATLHIALKFLTKCEATSHHCKKPIKVGYTIKTLNGVPYFGQVYLLKSLVSFIKFCESYIAFNS